ncbi:MAG: hypothetical protein HQM12_02925 [SAR324 cluster bacterium]|nr:hypothetical protein [SAR324 cluster bacterium]
MRVTTKIIGLTLFWSLLQGGPVMAVETAPRISDREIIEALTDIKAQLKGLREHQEFILREMDQRFKAVDQRFEAVDQRFEAVDQRFENQDKRFEDMNQRFEDMNRRFETVDQRFDQLINLTIGLLATFSAMMIATISFALWDRRTMIRPFETKVTAMEKQLERIPRMEQDIAANGQQLHQFLETLRSLSKTDPKLAEIMKTFSLL